MQIFTFTWLNSFATISRLHSLIFTYIQIQKAAQYNNELLSAHRDLQLLVREESVIVQRLSGKQTNNRSV